MYAVIKSVYMWSVDEFERPKIVGVFNDLDQAMKCMRNDFIDDFDYKSVEEYNNACDEESEEFKDDATGFEIDMEESGEVIATLVWNIQELPEVGRRVT